MTRYWPMSVAPCAAGSRRHASESICHNFFKNLQNWSLSAKLRQVNPSAHACSCIPFVTCNYQDLGSKNFCSGNERTIAQTQQPFPSCPLWHCSKRQRCHQVMSGRASQAHLNQHDTRNSAFLAPGFGRLCQAPISCDGTSCVVLLCRHYQQHSFLVS